VGPVAALGSCILAGLCVSGGTLVTKVGSTAEGGPTTEAEGPGSGAVGPKGSETAVGPPPEVISTCRWSRGSWFRAQAQSRSSWSTSKARHPELSNYSGGTASQSNKVEGRDLIDKSRDAVARELVIFTWRTLIEKNSLGAGKMTRRCTFIFAPSNTGARN
jgi:hypothetical protein